MAGRPIEDHQSDFVDRTDRDGAAPADHHAAGKLHIRGGVRSRRHEEISSAHGRPGRGGHGDLARHRARRSAHREARGVAEGTGAAVRFTFNLSFARLGTKLVPVTVSAVPGAPMVGLKEEMVGAPVGTLAVI